MLAFADVLDLFMNECARLRGGRLPFALGLARLLDRFLLRHVYLVMCLSHDESVSKALARRSRHVARDPLHQACWLVGGESREQRVRLLFDEHHRAMLGPEKAHIYGVVQQL